MNVATGVFCVILAIVLLLISVLQFQEKGFLLK